MKQRPRTLPGARPPQRLAHALVALLVAAGVVLRVVHLPVAVYTPDEDAYAEFYAAPMFEHGLGDLPRLVREYDARPDMREFPSPTRVGHLWAIVGLMNLVGHATIQNAAWVSALASMVMLLLIARIGLGWLGPWPAAIALLFATVSPLDLAMARRVWGDELFAACALASLWALLEHSAGAGRARWMGACLAFAGYSVLVKESGVLVVALVTIGLAIVAWRTRGWRRAAPALLAGGLTLVVAASVLAFACGGFGPLRATLARVAVAGPSNAYMREYQTGGADYYAQGLLRLQPLPVILGVAGALAAVFGLLPRGEGPGQPRTRVALVTLGGFTLAFLAVAHFWAQKNLRFLSPVYAPLDLLAAAVVWQAVEAGRARLPAPVHRTGVAVLAALLLAAAAADHQRFVERFEVRGIPDLATPWFTRPGR